MLNVMAGNSLKIFILTDKSTRPSNMAQSTNLEALYTITDLNYNNYMVYGQLCVYRFRGI